MATLKEMVANDAMVTFKHYKSNELWYVTDSGFEFPVPTEDCGDATFFASDRAMLFMRYIRKHMQAIEAARLEQE